MTTHTIDTNNLTFSHWKLGTHDGQDGLLLVFKDGDQDVHFVLPDEMAGEIADFIVSHTNLIDVYYNSVRV